MVEEMPMTPTQKIMRGRLAALLGQTGRGRQMIEMWELVGENDRRYSNFSWRTRMALRHKQLDVEYRPILLTDKESIAFSGGTTVPVIRDGDTVVRDSWSIAEYLESDLSGATVALRRRHRPGAGAPGQQLGGPHRAGGGLPAARHRRAGGPARGRPAAISAA